MTGNFVRRPGQAWPLEAGKHDFGPAFPFEFEFMVDENGNTQTVTHPGMDLRDWLAGQALHGIVSLARRDVAADAELAYMYADEMLKARDK